MAGTEIEPFKAAIVLRFMTEWPMVAYALVLIAASLFIERFYCRFACPLGRRAAILGKVRGFNSLKRHSECGTRCRVCETVCPVGAIKRNGQINMNECFFCLDCQVTYYDDHTCPPMVWHRKLLEQQSGLPTRPAGTPRPGGKPMSFAKSGRRRAITVLGAFAGLPLLASDRRTVRSPTALDQWQGTSLGSPSRLLLYHPSQAADRAIVALCAAEIERLERIFALYRDDSEIAVPESGWPDYGFPRMISCWFCRSAPDCPR